MMHAQRLTFGGAGASLAETKLHARIDFSDDDAAISAMLSAATRDLEEFAGIALLTQTIRVRILDGWPLTRVIHLPIGPVQDGASVTVTADGETFAGFDLWPGQRARLILTDDLSTDLAAAELVIEYPAGFGGLENVPDDLRLAVMDQTLALYDARGPGNPKTLALSPHAARIAARYRGVRL